MARHSNRSHASVGPLLATALGGAAGAGVYALDAGLAWAIFTFIGFVLWPALWLLLRSLHRDAPTLPPTAEELAKHRWALPWRLLGLVVVLISAGACLVAMLSTKDSRWLIGILLAAAAGLGFIGWQFCHPKSTPRHLLAWAAGLIVAYDTNIASNAGGSQHDVSRLINPLITALRPVIFTEAKRAAGEALDERKDEWADAISARVLKRIALQSVSQEEVRKRIVSDAAGLRESTRGTPPNHTINTDAALESMLAMAAFIEFKNGSQFGLRSYELAAEHFPSHLASNLEYAKALLRCDQPERAVAPATRAVQIDPSSSEARISLAAIYRALGRNRDAVLEYESATALNAAPGSWRLDYADALGAEGRFGEMATLVEHANATDPTARGWERLGFANFHLGDHQKSLAMFRRALAIDSNYWPALNGAGVCLLNKYIAGGKKDARLKEDALNMLRRSVQIEPNQLRIKELLLEHSN